MKIGECMKRKCNECKNYINCFRYQKGSGWKKLKNMQRNSTNQTHGKNVG